MGFVPMKVFRFLPMNLYFLKNFVRIILRPTLKWIFSQKIYILFCQCSMATFNLWPLQLKFLHWGFLWLFSSNPLWRQACGWTCRKIFLSVSLPSFETGGFHYNSGECVGVGRRCVCMSGWVSILIPFVVPVQIVRVGYPYTLHLSLNLTFVL